MSEREIACGLCQNWHVTDLEYWGICYINEADFREPTVTAEEDDCDCGRFSPRDGGD